jgi:hypothetical protein
LQVAVRLGFARHNRYQQRNARRGWPCHPSAVVKVPVQSWHPVTKIAVSLGLLGLVITWWTSDSPPSENVLATVRAQPAPPEVPAAVDVQPTFGVPLSDRALPPLSAFETMVSRPLFMPDRRPAKVELSLAATTMPPVDPEPADDVYPPDIDFIGSIEDGGSVRALISNGGNVQAVELGELIDGWEVAVIEPRRLRLELSEHYLELTILE